MALVTYTPSDDPADAMPARTSQYGYDFTRGEPVEVGGPALAKFDGHPFFRVEGGAAEPADPDKLEAVHKGAGKWIIVRGGDKANPVKDGLDKSDAAAFNALSDEDKAAYVAD